MRMELAAIAKLTDHEEDTSDFASMSRYLLDFRGQLQSHSHGVIEIFPTVKAFADHAMAAGASPTD